eukprot:UN2473
MPPQAELDKLFADMTTDWSHMVPTELFRDWARETAQLACRGIYSSITVNHADGSQTLESKVSEATWNGWVKLAHEITIRSGVRLAYVLLDVIEHRKHKLHFLDGRGRQHRLTRYRRNFGINLCIAAVVVPTILVLLKLHERVGSKSFTGLVLKHLKM